MNMITFWLILIDDINDPEKDIEDGIRKRIQEDLKTSAAKYADHAEIIISKLQAAYFKKHHTW